MDLREERVMLGHQVDQVLLVQWENLDPLAPGEKMESPDYLDHLYVQVINRLQLQTFTKDNSVPL